MRKQRFSPEEIAGALDKLAKGTSLRELSLEMNVAESTLYRWRKQYSGTTGIDNSRKLERENAHLRQVNYSQKIEIEVLVAQLRKAQAISSVAIAPQATHQAHSASAMES